MHVTNTTRERLTVIVKGEPQNGDAPTDSIEPGETKTVNVDPENPSFKGLLFAGALVEERSARKAAAKE
jgi:hypothetical protein